jgi:hypothetical protein
MKRLAAKFTYANVMATVAVFLALGGVSYAAFKLPKNSVGAKQLKNGAVTAAKIKNGAVNGAKVAAGTIGTVPSATNATNAVNANNAANATHAISADSATTATSATNAADAGTLGGRPPSSFAAADVVRVASISREGIVDPAHSFGVSQANVSHPSTGTYCISGLPTEPIATVASQPFGAKVGQTVISRAETDRPCQVSITVFGALPAGNPEDSPFTIFIR